MLVELKCDKFRDDLKTGMVFNKTVNFICSYGEKSNSIGKTTVLLMIDYIYGGKRLNDVEICKKIDDFYICYCLEIRNEKYYFKANCKDRNDLYKCDDKYITLDKIKIEDYKNFLKKEYTTNLQFSFRDAFSRFFRIDKENDNKHFLSNPYKGSSLKKDLEVLLDLYDEFKQIKEKTNKLDLMKEDVKAVKILSKSNNLNNIIIKKSKYNENIKELEKINEFISDGYINETDAIMKLLESSSKKEILDIRKEYLENLNELFDIEDKINGNEYNYSIDDANVDMNKIKEIFDNIRVMDVEKIVKFHNDMKKILKEEFKSEIEDLKAKKLKLLNRQNKIEKMFNVNSLSKENKVEIMNNIVDKLLKKKMIESENDFYEKIMQLKDAVKINEKELKEEKEKKLIEIQNRINEKIDEIKANNLKRDFKIMKFNVYSASNYENVTNGDDGVGTKNENLILFDMTILEQSKLPLLIHDTTIMSDIDANRRQDIIKIYSFSSKQIFVSIDNCEDYNGEIKDIVDKYKIVTLGPNENRIFGNLINREEK